MKGPSTRRPVPPLRQHAERSLTFGWTLDRNPRRVKNLRRETDRRPGLSDDALHAAAVAVQLPGNVDRGPREVAEVGVGREAFRQRDVPDAPQHLPRPASERDGCEVESVVRDAGVDVNTAVV